MMNGECGMDCFLAHAIRSILQNTQDLVFFKDADCKYLACSNAFARMVGLQSADQVAGKRDGDFFRDDLAAHYISADRRVLESGEPFVNQIEPIPLSGGGIGYSSTSKYVVRGEQGRIIGLYGVGRDVTAQVQLEEERELSRKMFEGVLEVDITRDAVMRVESARWVEATKLLESVSFVRAVERFAELFIHMDYVEDFKAHYDLQKLRVGYEEGVDEFSHITYHRMNDGNYRWTEFSSRLYRSHIFGTLRMTTFVKDMDGEIRAQEQLRLRAERDALTGILNRESTMHKIREFLENSPRDSVHALLLIDLDQFKQVNDNMGHPFGDRVLRSVAKRINQAFRADDIVGRIGGDEFMVLLKNASSTQDAKRRAERIFCAVRTGSSEDMHVTCSVGASVYTPGKTVEQLYVEADAAMYRAKKGGHGVVAFYEPGEKVGNGGAANG